MMKMLHDNVLIEILTEQKSSVANLYLPESAQTGQIVKGKVLDVGPGIEYNATAILKPVSVLKDDIIWFNKFGGYEITINSKKLFVTSERNIVAIMREEKLA